METTETNEELNDTAVTLTQRIATLGQMLAAASRRMDRAIAAFKKNADDSKEDALFTKMDIAIAEHAKIRKFIASETELLASL